jgi:MFS family permease
MVCTFLQAALIGGAAIPAIPLPAFLALVTVAAFLVPPFDAARGALLPEILSDDRYVLAASVSTMTHQASQLGGFVAGGALVALISPQGALAADAATFLAAAVLFTFFLRPRPYVRNKPEKASSLLRETLEGIRYIFGNAEILPLMLIVWLVPLYLIAPEALATAYADELHRGPTAVGIFMASAAGGLILGSAVLTRLVSPSRRLLLIRPLGVAGALPLLVIVLRPSFLISVLCFILAGVCSACMIPAQAAIMVSVPADLRGRVFGVGATGLALAQAVGTLVAGAVAQLVPPSTVIAFGGLLGALAVGVFTRQQQSQRASAIGDSTRPAE